MKSVADESVDRQIVARLRNNRHSVWYVAEMSPSISDDEVLQLANKRTAPLITSDKDFGELVPEFCTVLKKSRARNFLHG